MTVLKGGEDGEHEKHLRILLHILRDRKLFAKLSSMALRFKVWELQRIWWLMVLWHLAWLGVVMLLCLLLLLLLPKWVVVLASKKRL